jgi:hypothetical protein
MGQEHLLAAVAGETDLIHDLLLLRCSHCSTIVVRPLAVGIALLLLELALVVVPLVGQEIAAVHTTHRDNHLDMVVGLVGWQQRSILRLARPDIK